ncbi:MAG: hypothetical protein AAB649_04940, partial [Patescibacteria group bacterium]
MKSFIAIICILGIAGTGVYWEAFGATTGTITATITARSISIVRDAAGGTITYGAVDLSSTTTTDPAGLNDANEKFGNNGSVTEKFSIASSDASGGVGWTITAGAPGSNTFRHSFTTTTVVTWQILDITDTYEYASSTVDVAATSTIYMKIETPSASDYVQKTITITV